MIYSDWKLVNHNWGQKNYSQAVQLCVYEIFQLNGGTGLNLSLQDYKSKVSEAVDNVVSRYGGLLKELEILATPGSWTKKSEKHADELNKKIVSEMKDNLMAFGESMHKISQHKTDKTQVISADNVDTNATFDVDGYLLTRPDGTASAALYKATTGEDFVATSLSDKSGAQSGSGLGAIAIIAVVILVLILVLKKK